MKKDIKATAPIFPMPVLMVATFNDDESVNVMNVAWATVVDRGVIGLNIGESKHTVQNIKKRGAFSVSIADATHVVEADYFGLVSGKNVGNKLAKAGMTYTKSTHVDAPIINEFPICMECEFVEFQSNDYGIGVIGKIVNVSAEEHLIDENGQVDMSKANAIAYDSYSHGYFSMGERIADGFSIGKKLIN